MGASSTRSRISVSLDARIKRKLEETVPARQRSRYVERAIEEALRRDALKQFGTFLDELLLPADGKETGSAFIQRRRRELDGRPLSVLDGEDDAGGRRVHHRKAP